jgi:lysophospholipase L1-like esterase
MRRTPLGPVTGRTLLALLGAVLAVLGVELVLRARLPERHCIWRPHLVQRFRPSPGVMPGVAGGAEVRVSSLGLRGDEPPPDGLRVLALGGSTTECLYLDQTEAWPQILQTALGRGAWVGNGGRSGLDGRHHAVQAPILLEEIPGVQVVVVLAGANDLLRRLARDESWRPSDLRSPETRRELRSEAFELVPTGRARIGDWALVDLARRQFRRTGAGTNQDAAGAVYETWRRHRRTTRALRSELPDLGPALAEHRRNVRALHAAARRHGARAVFVTQPALWRAGMPPALERRLWMGGVGRYQDEPGRPYYSAAALRRGLDAYNAALLSTCEGLAGAVCFDLAAAVPPDGRHFYDDVHFNEAGSRLVARRLAPVVARSLRDGPASSPATPADATSP